MGCILAEMISCSTNYSNETNFDSKERFIFGGLSCYPLSPNEESEISENDQLYKILKTIKLEKNC